VVETIRGAVTTVTALFGGGEGGGGGLLGTLDALVDGFTIAGQVVAEVVEFVVKFIAERVKLVINVVAGLVEFVVAVVRGDWTAAWEAVKSIVDAAWQAVKGIVDAAVELVLGIFAAFGVDLGEVWDGVWAAIKGEVDGAWETMKSTVQGGIDAVVGFFSDGWSTVTGGVVGFFGMLERRFTKGLSDLVDWVKGAANDLIGLFEGAANAGIGMVNRILGAWNGIKLSLPPVSIPVVGEVFGGAEIGVPQIPAIPTVTLPRLADGGSVRRPTVALVGERGPEAVIPLREGRMGASLTVNVTVTGDVYGVDDFDELVAAAVNRAARRRTLDLA